MKVEVVSPFPFHALPRVFGWMAPFWEKVADDFTPRNLNDFMERMAEQWDKEKTWAIHINGELGGLVSFVRLSPWLGTAHVLLKPDFQGRGIAVEACRTAFAEMFAQGVGKLSFYPFAGNNGMASLLVKLGAKREGLLEGHTLSNGKPVDMWLYGLSREAFEKEKDHAAVSTASDHSGGARGDLEHPGRDIREQTPDVHHEPTDPEPGDHNSEPVGTAHILA